MGRVRGVGVVPQNSRRGMRAAWPRLVAILAVLAAGHVRAAGGDDGRFGVAECTPSSPCVHLVAHSHMDPGWRNTFDQYIIGSGNGIHRSAVLACARDPARRFTFGDAAFLVRWLESEGGEAPPEDCVYSPTPSRGRGPCGTTWLELFRSLVRDGRVDVVGGGWVSHDEAVTPVHLAAANFDAGADALRAVIGDADWRPTVAWQIDPFGHAASTPTLLAHLGYTHIVVNRVPRGARREAVRRREREFVWTRGGTRSGGKVVAHLLRRHYNVPSALDFTGERADVDWTAAAGALEAEAVASFEGLAHGAGRAMMLVGDDFRFKDAERTFAAWETLLSRVGSGNWDGDRDGDGNRDGGGRRAGPRGGKRSAFRFAWSTPAEYFAASASNRFDKPLPTRSGSFLPYADNWPVSENAWVGSFVHRRELKRAVIASSTAALDAGSLAALVPNANDVERIETSRAARASYLGLHHDAITGTCPKSVADDFTAWARKGEALARDATARSAARALQCDVGAEHSWTEEHGWTGSDGGAARLREPGDAVAVHNPTGWFLPYAEVRLLVGRRVKVVDARTGRAVPTQERRTDGVRFLNGLLRSRSSRSRSSHGADGEDDERIDGLSETVVALTDLPPLGIVRLAAVAAGDDTKADDDGRYAKAPRRDPAVTFESDGTAAVGGVKMSVASVASPADERFGDGPYVSRSGLWHALPVVVGALVCFVNVTFAAWVAARALGKRRAAVRRRRRRGLLDGASPVKSSKPRGVGGGGFLSTFAARARRFNRYSLAERSTMSKPLATRVARRFAAPAFIGVVLVLFTHSTACVSDASHGAIVRGGYRSGAWIGGAAGLVNAARSRGKGTMGGAAASGCVAALAAFVTLARAPSLSHRGMVGHGLIAPRCFAGEVYTECVARFGAVANPSLPSAVLTVRERTHRSPSLETEGDPVNPRRIRETETLNPNPNPIEVEWAAFAPEDVEIVARVAPSNGAASRGLLVDDGIGVTPHTWSSQRGWSVPANELPSGAFVALSPDPTSADVLGLVLSPGSAATSVAHVNGGAWLGVHRQAVNDDGHGLGAARRTLVDESPGALSFLVARGSVASLRRLAAESSRPATASSLGALDAACELAEWSPVAEPLPRHVEVLAVTERAPLGWTSMGGADEGRGLGGTGNEGGGLGGTAVPGFCPLWFRVRDAREASQLAAGRDGSDGVTTAASLERSLGSMGRIVMQPASLLPGEIGYVLVRRECER